MPSGVSKVVSRIKVPSRYWRVTRAEGSLGAIKNRPFCGVPSSAAKQAAESKRGGQNQSIEPDFDTSAAVSQLPMRP